MVVCTDSYESMTNNNKNLIYEEKARNNTQTHTNESSWSYLTEIQRNEHEEGIKEKN